MPTYIVNGWKPGTYWASVMVEAETAQAAIEPGRALLDECADWELTDDGAASNDVDDIEVLNEDGGEPCAKWRATTDRDTAARAMLAALQASENWLKEYEAGPDTGLHGLLDQLRTTISAAKAAGITEEA